MDNDPSSYILIPSRISSSQIDALRKSNPLISYFFSPFHPCPWLCNAHSSALSTVITSSCFAPTTFSRCYPTRLPTLTQVTASTENLHDWRRLSGELRIKSFVWRDSRWWRQMSAARTDALFRGASLTANPEETTTWLNLYEKKIFFFQNMTKRWQIQLAMEEKKRV